VLASAREIPEGAHAVSFHVTRREAAEHAAAFLAGTPQGQAARYWVPDERLVEFYAGVAGEHAPDHVGCVGVLPKEQVEPLRGKLRPVAEVSEFIAEHPEGVTAAGDTISAYWTPTTAPDHLEYEEWFQSQPRQHSRFLCPYDLRSVPPELAPKVMRELGSHHTHVILSDASDDVARLLELFIFETTNDLPEELNVTLSWALREGLIEVEGSTHAFHLTPSGDRVVRSWSRTAT
jgi:hypothetical protein